MHMAFKFLHKSGVNRPAKTTKITGRLAPRDPVKRVASNGVAVSKRAVANMSDDCSGGFRSALSGICQLCNAPESPYDEVICPCTADHNAVVGCKEGYEGNPSCLSRTRALAECATRGITLPSNPTEYTRPSTASLSVIQHAGSSFSQSLDNNVTSTSPDTAKLDYHNTTQLSREAYAGLSAGTLLVLATVFGVVRLQKRFRKRRRRRQELQGNPSHSSSDRSSDALPLQDVLVEPANDASLIKEVSMEPSDNEQQVLSTVPVTAVSETRCCSMLFETSALLRGPAGRNDETIIVYSQGEPDTAATDGCTIIVNGHTLV